MDQNNKNVNVHDRFFRTAMSDLRVAKDFFSSHLPADIRDIIDLNKLVFMPRSHINDVRQETVVDVLYKTKVGNRDAFLYLLLEHQSSPDKLMPFRMLKYTCNVIDEHLKQTKSKLLPLVYPMVIYHGERPYPFSNDIKDIVDGPAELIKQYFLQPFQLIDLGKIEDEEIKKRIWSGVMEFALKHIFAQDMYIHLRKIVANLRHLDRSGGTDYIFHVLQYILERGEFKNINSFYEIINKEISYEVGGEVMSLGDRLRSEGRQEGRVEGKVEAKIEFARNLLADGIELSLIGKYTGLTIEKIQSLINSEIEKTSLNS